MALSTAQPDTAATDPPPTRRTGAPRLALALIRTGPVLMLLAGRRGGERAVAGVLHDPQRRQRAGPDRGDRGPRHRPAAGDPHPRHRPVGRLDARPGVRRRRARLRGGAVRRRSSILAMLAHRRWPSAPSTASVYVWGRLPHPFIITLATLSIARGSRAVAVRRAAEPGHARRRPDASAAGRSAGCPYSTLPRRRRWRCSCSLLTTRLVWGRWIYAVGGNPEAARRAGIPVNAVLVSVYVLSGLAAGVAAIITAGRLNAGSPTFGELAELDSIAAVVIGGASFLGGRGNVGQRPGRRADDRRHPQRR